MPQTGGYGHFGFRPGYGRFRRPFYGRPFGFGVPFLLGAALGSSLYNPYYGYPYYPYPYY